MESKIIQYVIQCKDSGHSTLPSTWRKTLGREFCKDEKKIALARFRANRESAKNIPSLSYRLVKRTITDEVIEE